jgi:hypothetical protein
MPPRRSTDAAGAASQERAPATTFTDLPHAVLLKILALLPVDVRLRCAEACRAWRAALSDRSLWTRLDFSPAGGVLCRHGPEAEMMFHTAVARCGFGHLRALDVSCFPALRPQLLTAVARVNARSLEVLRVCHGLDFQDERDSPLMFEEAETLLREAPQLRSVEVEAVGSGDLETALSMLQRTPPFAALRLRGLRFQFAPEADDNSVTELASAVSASATITELFLDNAPLRTPLASAAVVDAALARLLTRVSLIHCSLCPASVPALARLLRSGSLRSLETWNHQEQLLDPPAATLLAGALRANATLLHVNFNGCDLWRDMDAARTLIAALTGHVSIQTLCLTGNEVHDGLGVAAGEAFGSLLEADAGALQELRVSQRHPLPPHTVLQQGLGDDGMARLLHGLARNTHLRRLEVCRNSITEEFAHEMLRRVAGAHPALRQLDAEEATFDASAMFNYKP